MPPIDQHYKQSRSRASSGQSYHKTSAGVDRSQPLAPIPVAGGGRRGNANGNNSNNGPAASQSPFSNKPRMVKHNNASPETDENDNYKSYNSNQSSNKSPAKKFPAAPAAAGRGARRPPADNNPKEEKISDFKKWQMEQNRARGERLKKANSRAPAASGDWEREGEEEEDEERGGGGSSHERQLMERIARQQAELERMKKNREQEEERVSEWCGV